ncbi:hypothetical protein CXG81DRAFT_15900 [Caulochytrium protostelioides]|uniref:Uncharacterized protein n=1 Tax=Caulochytrium protostelioides TaxID=1555241 RepID=A0A4V1ITW3_9FUNG|nr:hypothetical protein CXG81DRAFT_15900 [Caulochytrium protostelioides]|eukprot:RKO98457.1 hypothetical protein CXG81DRAFT_15900 [Caulochytrium protostelioides]
MVHLHVKKGTDSLFLVAADAADPVADVLRHVCAVHALRLRLGRLIEHIAVLAEYGPLKPLDQHGYTEAQLTALAAAEPGDAAATTTVATTADGRQVCLRPDPTGRRTGEAPLPSQVAVLEAACAEAAAAIAADRAARRELLTVEALETALASLRGAVAMVWPMGLPAEDPVAACLADDELLEGTPAAAEPTDPATAALWWAGKRLEPAKPLAAYVGTNNKTTIVVKLQRATQGAPVREPPLDEQAQKHLMAYYYRKQEADKALRADADDAYVNAPWAQTNQLKAAFSGVGLGGIAYKP